MALFEKSPVVYLHEFLKLILEHERLEKLFIAHTEQLRQAAIALHSGVLGADTRLRVTESALKPVIEGLEKINSNILKEAREVLKSYRIKPL